MSGAHVAHLPPARGPTEKKRRPDHLTPRCPMPGMQSPLVMSFAVQRRQSGRRDERRSRRLRALIDTAAAATIRSLCMSSRAVWDGVGVPSASATDLLQSSEPSPARSLQPHGGRGP